MGSNQSLSGNGPFNSSFVDTPAAGIYWYGVHASDGLGNYATESDSGLSSKKVTVTAPQAPYKATSPSPANSTTGGLISVVLSWANGGGATSYDVYFGTDSTPDSGELEGTQSPTSFNPPTLAYSTTYYWRIDARNANGVTPGDVWSFTTVAAPVTKVISLTGIMAFGSVTVGSSAGATLTITNTGNSTLTVSSISYPSGFSGNWPSGTIAANSSQNVSVIFSPTTAITYNGTITVNSDKTSGTNTISCSGTGTTPPLPSKATSPNPSNGNTAGLISVVLSWSNGGGATSYDVYFGTDSTPDSGELEGTQTPTNFNPPTLAYSMTYYWRIDARNANGVTPGDVWSFTTVAAPATKVISLTGIMSFGSVTVGSSAGASLTISNTGNSTLTVNSISYPSGFSGNWPSGTIAANSSQNVSVTFSPTSAVAYNGTITVASDKTSGTNTISCSGTGAAVATALQTWRETYFGSIINSGDGADLNDFDNDGIPNLLEFAFGLHPKQNSAGTLPQPQKVGTNLVVNFTQPGGVSGVTYGAEWSQTLSPGSWTAVSNSSTPPQHTYSVPIGSKTSLYMRLKVTNS